MIDNQADVCEEYCVNKGNIQKVTNSMPEMETVSKLAEVFKVLGDPTRIKIIFALSQCDMCVCDISETVGLSQSAISHQLRLLRNLRLVKFKKEGKVVTYSLDDDHILQLFKQGMEHVKHS